MQVPSSPPHDRKLGLLGVALVKGRFRGDSEALGNVRDDMERRIILDGWFPNDRFSWVTLSLRYGRKNDPSPQFGQVSEKYGDLPLSIEIDAHEILDAQSSPERLVLLFAHHVQRSLATVAAKYEFSVENLLADAHA